MIQRDFFRTYFQPKTLEQSLGLHYLIMALSMIPRPFLAGIENLTIYYGITPLAPRFIGVLLALFALVLILKKRCGRKLFSFMLLPIPLYMVCLAFYFKDHPTVGLAGTLAFVGLTECLISMYRNRAARRKLER